MKSMFLRDCSVEVKRILERVRKTGDRGVEYYTKKFDHLSLKVSRSSVPESEMKRAYSRIPSSLRKALLSVARRIELFHREEWKRIPKRWEVSSDGIRTGQIASPFSRVGVYVPGGRATYPSTVLMTCIPARVAGVKEIVLVTPPQKSLGSKGCACRDEILAAAWIAGTDRLFTVGGPQAIAALSFGTETIPKVDKIVGPGNKYVTEAKRQVFGLVGIDGLAGPSEIAVWADHTADPSTVAVNLLAQAEHDPDAKSFLFSANSSILSSVRSKIPGRFLRQVQFSLVRSEKEIVNRINDLAPEHLYLAVRNPRRILKKGFNAGAIFLGEKTPVPLGDYAAGPSHVLPTDRSARFSSGLSVKDFLKWSSVIENKSMNSSRIFEAARTLAETEGLSYHARSLELVNR